MVKERDLLGGEGVCDQYVVLAESKWPIGRPLAFWGGGGGGGQPKTPMQFCRIHSRASLAASQAFKLETNCSQHMKKVA